MNKTRLDFQKQTLEYFIDARNIKTEKAFLQKMNEVLYDVSGMDRRAACRHLCGSPQ